MGCAQISASGTADAQPQSYETTFGPAADAAPARADPSALAPASPAAERQNAVLLTALGYLGVRYRRGGDRPESGFDCSGLVRWVYDRTLGIALPRRSEDIARVGAEVEKDELRPGDLVFFNTLRRSFSHVGIYLGDGRFVHAPSTGGRVRIEDLDQAYWRTRWNGARRVDAIVADTSGH